MLIQEKDKVQLFDPAMVRQINELFGDVDAAWAFVLDRLSTLRSLKKFDSGFMFAFSYGMERFEDAFYRFFDNDPECVVQCLINDVAFIGEQFKPNFWTRCGYLDHASSADVETSKSMISMWSEETEAYAYFRPFDVLSVEQVALMAAALKKNRAQVDPAEFTADIEVLDTFVSVLTRSPELRAAYMYETNGARF